MTATSQPPPASPETAPPAHFRWQDLVPIAAFAAAPKCLFCAAAYVVGGAALFGSRPELCGDTASRWPAVATPLLGAAVGLVFAMGRRVRTQRRSRLAGALMDRGGHQ